MNLLLLGWTFASILLSTSAQPKPCECIGQIMNCYAKDLTSFGPKNFCPGKITRLAIMNNRISTLPTNAFSGLRDLELLVLDSNNLTALPSGIFNGLKELEILSIQYNRLKSLPNDIFKGLKEIEIIALQSNELTTLHPQIFSSLKNIEKISLGSNPLKNIPNNLFYGLKKLTLLDLTKVGISVIPANLFKDLQNLEELFLSFNTIKTINSNDLTGIKSLKNLWLDFNEITSLPMYTSSWPKIETAVFYGNKIEDVNEFVLKSWLESGGRVKLLNLATATSTPLRNPASLRWVLNAKGVTTSVSNNCRCGVIQKSSTRVQLCLAVECGGVNQPKDWVEAVRMSAGGRGVGSNTQGGGGGRVSLGRFDKMNHG